LPKAAVQLSAQIRHLRSAGDCPRCAHFSRSTILASFSKAEMRAGALTASFELTKRESRCLWDGLRPFFPVSDPVLRMTDAHSRGGRGADCRRQDQTCASLGLANILHGGKERRLSWK